MYNSSRCARTVFGCICLLLSGCDQQLPAWNAGKVVIIVPANSLGAEAEFERELAQLFAEQLNAKLEMVSMPQKRIRTELRKHRAHLAAFSLRSETSITTLNFGPIYQSVRELVICNRIGHPPRKLADLEGKTLAVVAGSAHEEALREARETLPTLQWKTRYTVTTNELLAKVASGTLDCAVANEQQFADARNYHSNLIAAFDVAQPSKLAWGFPKDADPELLNQARIFFTHIQQDGTLHRLLDRYFGHNNRLDTMDAAAFITGINTVLPHYHHLFEEAATLTGEDWRLLAALAYQESQWDPIATSYTNVRGMMMLTEDTADQMRVGNRLDARESIMAGAKYLAMLKEQMPARIPEPDRTWLALAAYNQGYSHLEDARILTKRAGHNPDSWTDVKKWMPLLSQHRYYKSLKHGFAHGGEAVVLVENIRSYYDMLKRLKPDQDLAGSSAISYRLIAPLQRLLHPQGVEEHDSIASQ